MLSQSSLGMKGRALPPLTKRKGPAPRFTAFRVTSSANRQPLGDDPAVPRRRRATACFSNQTSQTRRIFANASSTRGAATEKDTDSGARAPEPQPSYLPESDDPLKFKVFP